MAFLRAVEGPLTDQEFVIPDGDRVIVGRYEIYDLIVPDPSISRKHFAVEKRADGFYIVDLGSLNGTQLNGHRVSTAKLEQDDRIAAGETVLAFHEASSSAAAAAPAADAEVESISDDDIILDPDASLAPASPATIPMVAASPPEESEEPKEPKEPKEAKEAKEPKEPKEPKEHEEAEKPEEAEDKPAKTKRPSRNKKRAGKGEGKSAGRCAACGRKVSQEDVDTGDCAKTRLGFVCSRCIEKRQKSGDKGSLENFITERQKRRR